MAVGDAVAGLFFHFGEDVADYFGRVVGRFWGAGDLEGVSWGVEWSCDGGRVIWVGGLVEEYVVVKESVWVLREEKGREERKYSRESEGRRMCNAIRRVNRPNNHDRLRK